MGRRHDKRDAQLAELLDQGYSYADLAKLAGISVPSVKMAIRTKYPEIYKRHKSQRGRPASLDSKTTQLRREAHDRRLREQAEVDKRHAEIRDYLFSDPLLTLEDVGEKFGITRERVRQIASKDIGRYGQRFAERRRIRAEARAKPPRFCAVCNAEVPPGKVRFCSEEHRQVMTALRYHVDPDRREAQKVAVAKWVLRAAAEGHPKVDERQVAFADRVLDPEVELEVHGRWFTQGSQPLEYAVEAYEKGWPIFEKLPEPLQKQVVLVHEARMEASGQWET